jgi:hypothetical protein
VEKAKQERSHGLQGDELDPEQHRIGSKE